MDRNSIDIADLITPVVLYKAIGMDPGAFWMKYHKGDIKGSVMICNTLFFVRSKVVILCYVKTRGKRYKEWVAKGRPITPYQQKDSITDTLSPPQSNG